MNFAFALALAVAVEPPSFDALVKETSATNTPIVIDVFTTWCKPCAELEKTTFSNPKVIAALSKARFIRYDAERGPGVEVADRFAINSYPSVLLLTPDGTLMTRLVAQTPEGFVAEVSPLLPIAGVSGPFTDDALSKKDADPRALYVAGVQAMKSAPAKAMALLTRAAARDADGLAGIRGLAQTHLAKEQYRVALTEAKMKALLAMAQGDPAVPSTVDALGSLSQYPGQYDQAQAKATGARISAALAKSKNTAALNQLLYAQLALMDTDGALVTAKALETLSAGDSNSMDSVAEAYFQANQKEKAIEIEKAAIALAPSKALQANLARFQTEEPSLPPYDVSSPLPEVDPMPSSVSAYFSAQKQLGAAIADECKTLAGKAKTAYLRLSFTGPKVTKALAFDIETPAALKQCLEKAAKTKASPALGSHGDLDLQVRFPLPK